MLRFMNSKMGQNYLCQGRALSGPSRYYNRIAEEKIKLYCNHLFQKYSEIRNCKKRQEGI